MAAYYLVYRSDLAEACDRYVTRRTNRKAAWRIVCRLNAEEVAKSGQLAPLYYTIRSDDGGAGKNMADLDRKKARLEE